MKQEALITLSGGQLPGQGQSYSAILDSMDQQILARDSSISTGSLSNAHGDWYEWMLAVAAWNLAATNRDADLALLMPNIAQFDMATLYVDDLSELIFDLRAKVAAAGVQLISSNPDFVIISRAKVNEVLGSVQKIQGFNATSIEQMSKTYREFVNRCGFEDLVGFASVKTSFRPDRRLQIAHEGSLMKALYVHMQTRNWVLNPPGLKYYAVSTSVGDADRNALQTVATHSITTVASIPQSAVDGVFEVNSAAAADTAFRAMLIR